MNPFFALVRLGVVFTLALLLGIAGCGGNALTQANYDRIETGMTLSEVESILGKGTEQASSAAEFGNFSMQGKSMVWQNENRMVTVVLMNDKVMSKAQVGLK